MITGHLMRSPTPEQIAAYIAPYTGKKRRRLDALTDAERLEANSRYRRRYAARHAARCANSQRKYNARNPDKLEMWRHHGFLRFMQLHPNYLFAWAPHVIRIEEAYWLAAPCLNPFEMLALKEEALACLALAPPERRRAA